MAPSQNIRCFCKRSTGTCQKIVKTIATLGIFFWIYYFCFPSMLNLYGGIISLGTPSPNYFYLVHGFSVLIITLVFLLKCVSEAYKTFKKKRLQERIRNEETRQMEMIQVTNNRHWASEDRFHHESIWTVSHDLECRSVWMDAQRHLRNKPIV